METKKSAKGSTARYLAIFDAAAFLVFGALYSWFILSPEQTGGVTWQQVGVVLTDLLGAMLLLFGAVRWYGRTARLHRLAGFLLLFASAVVNISFAFLTIPILLLAVFSLGSFEHGEPHRARTTAPEDFIMALGAITLSISIFLPWYSWVFQNGLGSHSVLVSLWDASKIVAIVILAADLIILGAMVFPLIVNLSRWWKSPLEPGWKEWILLVAGAAASVMTGYRMVALPVGEGARSDPSIGPGFLFGLVGVTLLLFGIVFRLFHKLRLIGGASV